MIKGFHRQKEILTLSYIISIFSVICYRWFIIKDYASQWIDDDQALLWYGTVSAARFGIVEPHFLGQAYGSMLESIIAVPLYWLRISLNYALPIATFILWFAPFLICSLKVWENNKIFSIIMVLTSILQHWDYDIISGMPRSFISGFAFAFIGIILLIESNDKSKWKAFVAPLILALAYINSETSITIIGLGILYYLLYCISTLHTTWRRISLGFFVGILLILFCNKWFYILNPEYNLHGGANTMSFSWSVLTHNFTNIKDLASSFSIINIGNIPIILIVTIVLIILLIFAYKQWQLILVFICAVIGSILLLAHPKSLDYCDTLYFSQARMFLFIPYIILLLMFLLCLSTRRMESWKSIIGVLAAGICIFVATGKILYFETDVQAKDELYTSAVLNVINIEDIYTAAEEIKKYANDNNCGIVVLLPKNQGMGYATGAINYSDYISYNAYYERRTATYLDLKKRYIDQNVLFVCCEGNAVSNMTSELVTGNLIAYIRNNKGIQRYNANSEYYIRHYLVYELGDAIDTIDFHSDQYNADAYVQKGLSAKEDGGSWTEGDELVLSFALHDTNSPLIGMSIDVSDAFFHPQSVLILINGEEVYRDTIEGNATLKFVFENPGTDMVELTMILPDSVAPSEVMESDDSRVLGVRLLTAKVAEVECVLSEIPDDGVIHFAGVDYNANLYVLDGISPPGKEAAWTLGNRMLAHFALTNSSTNADTVHVSMDLESVSTGQQDIAISINGENVFEGPVAEGENAVSFDMPYPEDGYILMAVKISDAVSPLELGASDDSGELGLMIKNIKFVVE